MFEKLLSKFMPVRQVKSYVPVQTQSFHGWLTNIGRSDVAKSVASIYYVKCYPVSAAITEISDRLKNIKPIFLDKSGEEIVNDSIKFLQKPNDRDTFHDLLNKLNINYKTSGEMYLMKVGITRVMEVHVLPSSKLQVNQISGSEPKSFLYNNGNTSFTFNKDERGRFFDKSGTRELCYYHEYNPTNMTCGLSPLSSISLEIEQYMSAGTHNLAMLTNSIKPSVVLSSKSDFMPNPEQMAQFKQLLDEFYKGSGNAGNYLVTGNFDVNTISQRSDMDYKDLTNAVRNSIFQKLGVPLTIADTTASTYNNRQLDQLAFYDDTVIPLFRMYAMWLINSVQSDFKGTQIIADVKINDTDIPALSERALTNLERRSKIGHMSINELREADNYEEVDGGSFIYRPSSDVAVSSGEMTENDLEEAKQWLR
jgi:HK97 family phage portal protein